VRELWPGQYHLGVTFLFGERNAGYHRSRVPSESSCTGSWRSESTRFWMCREPGFDFDFISLLR